MDSSTTVLYQSDTSRITKEETQAIVAIWIG